MCSWWDLRHAPKHTAVGAGKPFYRLSYLFLYTYAYTNTHMAHLLLSELKSPLKLTLGHESSQCRYLCHAKIGGDCGYDKLIRGGHRACVRGPELTVQNLFFF